MESFPPRDLFSSKIPFPKLLSNPFFTRDRESEDRGLPEVGPLRTRTLRTPCGTSPQTKDGSLRTYCPLSSQLRHRLNPLSVRGRCEPSFTGCKLVLSPTTQDPRTKSSGPRLKFQFHHQPVKQSRRIFLDGLIQYPGFLRSDALPLSSSCSGPTHHRRFPEVRPRRLGGRVFKGTSSECLLSWILNSLSGSQRSSITVVKFVDGPDLLRFCLILGR